MVQKLNENQLAFEVTMPLGVLQPWRIINETLFSHCHDQALHLPKNDGDDGENFNRLSWDLLTEGTYRNGITYYKTQQVFMINFDVPYLQKMAVADPETAQKRMLILCINLAILPFFLLTNF